MSKGHLCLKRMENIFEVKKFVNNENESKNERVKDFLNRNVELSITDDEVKNANLEKLTTAEQEKLITSSFFLFGVNERLKELLEKVTPK